jgi:DMSO/TMAO reductase YedYZ molybdopterin-dependent catalytic subunit
VLRRRKFLKTAFGLLSGVGLLLSPLNVMLRRVVAMTGRILLPKGTDRKTLINKDPATLDTRNLETTPLQDFGTMGLTDHSVNLKSWRLMVAGNVKRPLSLSYEEILRLPPMEKRVLIICPGFFANHGNWKGISLAVLLEMAQAESSVTRVKVRGPEGAGEKVETYPILDIQSDKVFLAYEVNGKPLPQKHGFPLRVVAEGYYGYDWVKYVCCVEAEKPAGTEKG